MAEGKATLGSWLQSCSPVMAEILAEAGFDWLLIDMEHSPLGLETLVSIIQAMKGTAAVPFVRAPWNDFVTIKRILDCGTYGIIVPYVNTREEAERAVAACKYPPAGIRGIAGSPRGNDYGATKERLKVISEEICVITQIETPAAAANIDDLLTVDGVDGFFIGPMDLSTSMGHFADPSHPEVQKTIRALEEKVLPSGKFLGTLTSSMEQAEELFRRGYQFVTVMSDTTSLGAMARERVNRFRTLGLG